MLEHRDEILAEIKTGDGLLHALIYAPASEQSILQEVSLALGRVSAAGESLNEILAKVDEGEGTLGLLVNDPSVFEDLRLLLGGAQRSTLLRSMIRMAAEGAEALATRPESHPKQGRPSQVWEYRDPQGEPLAYVFRFDPAEGRKVFAPLT